jgi:PAS domain S-box-containing protein
MNGKNETCDNEPPGSGSNLFNNSERLHELQVINEILTESYHIEDDDRICRLTGEAVLKLNKDCYVIVSLYDKNINAVKIRAAIGSDSITGNAADIPELSHNDIYFEPEELELYSRLLKSGKLESFEGGLHALLAKRVSHDIYKKIEQKLNIGSILVSGFSEEKKIFGCVFILVPEGKKIQSISAIETIIAHISKRIQNVRTKKEFIEAKNKFRILFQQAPLGYHTLDDKGNLTDVNNKWLEILGYSREEAIGKCFQAFLAPKYTEKFKDDLKILELKGAINEAEYEAVRKDGKIINIVIDGKNAYDRNGCINQIYCVLKDITAQKEAERKALENERLLRSVMDAITEYVIIVKPDLTIAYINETAARRLNLVQKECTGRSLQSIFPGNVYINRKKMLDSVLSEGEPVTYKDTREGFYFLHNNYPIYDSSNRLSYIAIFAVDITEYQKHEKELKWELNVNRELAELADALLDPNNSIETIAGIVLSASQRLTESEHGYVSSIDPESGDNICHTLTRMMESCNINEKDKKITFSKDQNGLYPKLIGCALNTRKGFYTNSPKTHPCSGGVPEGHIPLENFLSIPAIVGNELLGQISLANSRDGYSDSEFEAIRRVAALYALALQQKRAVADIQYRDTILKSVFESTVDGIIVTDINHNVHFLNSKFAKMLKLPETLENTSNSRKMLDLLFEKVKDPEEYLSKIQSLHRSDETDISYIDLKDGRVFERSSASLIINGTLKGRVWSVRDVTEKIEAEKALVDAKIHAEEANRTKSEFLATMSHELRTPLNSIIGYSDILIEQMFGALNERQMKYLKNISLSGNHLLNLINDILDISRIESGDVSLSLETVSVEDVFEDVKNIAVPFAASKNISVRFSSEPSDLEIYADKIKLKQILHNLLNNSLKFTPDNGHIEVEAKKLENTIEICVKDNGIGIPEDKYQIIFEPFKQVDSSLSRMYSGTGLGLTIVKNLVELHGGEIKVKSELTKGSTFTVLWPVKEK